MCKRFNEDNCCFDIDCCQEKRKRRDNCFYPSYIDDQVLFNVGVKEI